MSVNPEKVIEWREALVTLSDQHFFDLVRLYLGAIKTPFNKQRLIQDLSSFFRNEENKKKILENLDTFDIQILSAIRELSIPTQKNLVSFFAESCSYPELYDRLLNLEERLLIYRKDESKNREYAINPLLESDLEPFIGSHFLIHPESTIDELSFPLTVNNFSYAAMYNYFFHTSVTIKNNVGLRKKDIDELSKLSPFFESNEDLFLFVRSLENLGMLNQDDDTIIVHKARWVWFAQLDSTAQIAWLVAGMCLFSSREQLYRTAQTYYTFLLALDTQRVYSKASAQRLLFLIQEENKDMPFIGVTRFYNIVQSQKETDSLVKDIDVLATFIKIGALVSAKEGLCKNAALIKQPVGSAEQAQLIVSPSLSITFFPGFPLEPLIDLVSFMEMREVQIASVFEISRKACMQAFAYGMSPTMILEILKKFSKQDIPQNVEFSVHDWYRAYAAFSLDFGFVLQVEESKRFAFEKNEVFLPIIKKKLADGVYLLANISHDRIDAVFKEAGFDAAPSLPTFGTPQNLGPMIPLKVQNNRFKSAKKIGFKHEQNDSVDFRENLYAELKNLKFSKDISEVLESRIKRKIIINKNQLVEESVRLEKVEASGMDFLGKLRLVEQAIAQKSLLEIELEKEQTASEKIETLTVLGLPLGITKVVGDAILTLVLEPNKTEFQVSLGRALYIRRIRGSIFSEGSL